jgi:hypothetical protein
VNDFIDARAAETVAGVLWLTAAVTVLSSVAAPDWTALTSELKSELAVSERFFTELLISVMLFLTAGTVDFAIGFSLMVETVELSEESDLQKSDGCAPPDLQAAKPEAAATTHMLAAPSLVREYLMPSP